MTLKSFLELLIKSYSPKGAAKSNPYGVHLSISSFIKVVYIFKVRKLSCFFKKMLKKYNDFRGKKHEKHFKYLLGAFNQ